VADCCVNDYVVSDATACAILTIWLTVIFWTHDHQITFICIIGQCPNFDGYPVFSPQLSSKPWTATSDTTQLRSISNINPHLFCAPVNRVAFVCFHPWNQWFTLEENVGVPVLSHDMSALCVKGSKVSWNNAPWSCWGPLSLATYLPEAASPVSAE
jgi:hypothetical protein